MLIKNEIERALQLALIAHNGQVDKAGKPYILHPITVALRQDSEKCMIAALLHDVVEDSSFTLDDLRKQEFSDDVLEAVRLLTHEKGADYFEYVQALKHNDIARKVKIQDLLHNSDLRRLDTINPKDVQRVGKYKKALSILTI